MNLETIKNSYLFRQNYGFLGECYFPIKAFDLIDSKTIKRYFSIKKPYYANRNSDYYTRDILVLKERFFNYHDDLKWCMETIDQEDILQDLIFSIISHQLSDISKLMGMVYSHQTLRDKYFMMVKDSLQELCDTYIGVAIFKNYNKIKEYCGDEWQALFNDFKKLEIISVREYSEMDHPILLIKSFLVNYDFISDIGLLVGPLQGACLIPPMYISMFKLCSENIHRTFDYMRHSNYDNQHYIDINLSTQANLLNDKYDCNTSVLLIDDTAGTATTINSLRNKLKDYFTDIRTIVVECRWDSKLNNIDYPAFGLNDLDILTPLEYRHFKIFAAEIEYIKTDGNIRENYLSNGFYKESYIYDKIDFMKYLNESDINRINKNNLLKVVKNYKTMFGE